MEAGLALGLLLPAPAGAPAVKDDDADDKEGVETFWGAAADGDGDAITTAAGACTIGAEMITGADGEEKEGVTLVLLPDSTAFDPVTDAGAGGGDMTVSEGTGGGEATKADGGAAATDVSNLTAEV